MNVTSLQMRAASPSLATRNASVFSISSKSLTERVLFASLKPLFSFSTRLTRDSSSVILALSSDPFDVCFLGGGGVLDLPLDGGRGVDLVDGSTFSSSFNLAFSCRNSTIVFLTVAWSAFRFSSTVLTPSRASFFCLTSLFSRSLAFNKASNFSLYPYDESSSSPASDINTSVRSIESETDCLSTFISCCRTRHVSYAFSRSAVAFLDSCWYDNRSFCRDAFSSFNLRVHSSAVCTKSFISFIDALRFSFSSLSVSKAVAISIFSLPHPSVASCCS
mmetsp:Transcript_22397/g.36859  ORF Transcript_22397/g.36859 Transcript_22397/m.36859 type:complete len:276 (-) Transcript_22397:520-1347(-)